MTSSNQKSILVVSAARHLVGHGVEEVLEKAWSSENVPAATAKRFANTGFNINVQDEVATLKDLKRQLEEGSFDGVLLGWCIRGHVELTELFELLVNVCVDHVAQATIDGKPAPKMYFCRGPEDIVNATLRNFP